MINHPDFTLHSLIVPPSGEARITHAMNWQFTTVSPYVMQCNFVTGVILPGVVFTTPTDSSILPWPEKFDEMSSEEQESYRMHHRFTCRTRAYARSISRRDPVRSQALLLPHHDTLVYLVPNITHCIADGPQLLQGLLINLQENWDSIADGPCLIDFSDDEKAAHSAEMDALQEYFCNVLYLCEELGCLLDLSVKPERYETAMKLMKKRRDEWDESAMKGIFPIYEGAPSYYLN